MAEINQDFKSMAKEGALEGAKALGTLVKEALPGEVRPAVEAFQKGWQLHQRKQQPPEYYPTRSLYMG